MRQGRCAGPRQGPFQRERICRQRERRAGEGLHMPGFGRSLQPSVGRVSASRGPNRDRLYGPLGPARKRACRGRSDRPAADNLRADQSFVGRGGAPGRGAESLVLADGHRAAEPHARGERPAQRPASLRLRPGSGRPGRGECHLLLRTRHTPSGTHQTPVRRPGLSGSRRRGVRQLLRRERLGHPHLGPWNDRRQPAQTRLGVGTRLLELQQHKDRGHRAARSRDVVLRPVRMYGRRDRQREDRRAVALQRRRHRRGEQFTGPREGLLRALVRRRAGRQGADAEQRRARDGLHRRPAGRGRDVRALRRLVRLGPRDGHRRRDLCAVDQ